MRGRDPPSPSNGSLLDRTSPPLACLVSSAMRSAQSDELGLSVFRLNTPICQPDSRKEWLALSRHTCDRVEHLQALY